MSDLTLLEPTCPQCGSVCRRGPDGYDCPLCHQQAAERESDEQEPILALTIDEVLDCLQRLRIQYGSGDVPVMICVDGPDSSSIPYLPVENVMKDDDEPLKPVALLCISVSPRRLRVVS